MTPILENDLRRQSTFLGLSYMVVLSLTLFVFPSLPATGGSRQGGWLTPELIFKRNAFWVVLLEPRLCGVLVGKHLNVVFIANLLAGVDIYKDCHWSLLCFRFPQ
jgi:hypothetical protein